MTGSLTPPSPASGRGGEGAPTACCHGNGSAGGSTAHIRLLWRGLTGLLWVTWAVSASSAPLSNQLRDHPSPYLAMHGSDPVAWQDWSAEVLQRARAEHKPVFISSGYFACHWCHVMQRESYRNPDTAALLNRYFIPVKVDRELHPALDEFLIRFTEQTTGQAGWPLNVVLTPEGYPLIGLTYLPPDRFRNVLEQVRKLWEDDPARVSRLARQAAEELQAAATKPEESIPPPDQGDLADRLKAQSLILGDDLQGGFGHQIRFPMEPHLLALLELQALKSDPHLADFLRLTLDQIAGRGLRDHLGGGFFRYTVDPDWQTPHFEKMLYTQALLVPVYLRAAEVLGRERYRGVAAGTLDFSLGAMRSPDGAFIASLSAVDDKGVEGGYYLWRTEDLQRLLTPAERGLAERVWGLSGPARFEAGGLPIPTEEPAAAARALGMEPAEAEAILASARTKLLAARKGRDLPRDDKVLAGWNGLMLAALAEGYRVLREPRYRDAAEALRNHLVGRLWDGTRLYRARAAAGGLGEASLEDYAYIAQGLMSWSEVTGSQADRALAVRLVKEAWRRFYDRGWRLTDHPLLPAMPVEVALADSALPSPTALVLGLSLNSGEVDLAARAREAMELGRPAISERPFSYATQAWLTIKAKKPPTLEIGQ